MRFAIIAIGSALGFAAMPVACSSGATEPTSELAPASTSPAEAGTWAPPDEVDDSRCPEQTSYTDCHVCCLVAHPVLIELVWDSFRVCACQLSRPLPCVAECGEAYCGASFPMHSAPKACRVCWTAALETDDDELLGCMGKAALACDADRDCTRGLACDLKCPEPLPGESDDDAEDKVFEILDGGGR